MRDLSDYTDDEKERIALRARRNLHSECTLILTAGFSLAMLVTFFLSQYTILPVAFFLNLQPFGVWILLSLAISAAVAVWHYRRWRGPVLEAQELNTAFLYAYQDRQRATREDGGPDS